MDFGVIFRVVQDTLVGRCIGLLGLVWEITWRTENIKQSLKTAFHGNTAQVENNLTEVCVLILFSLEPQNLMALPGLLAVPVAVRM